MEPVIKILGEGDEGLLIEAWGWADSAPSWFREVQSAHKETLKGFLDGLNEELVIGIFIDNKISSVIRFVPMEGFHELHLMAKRGMDWEVLKEACEAVKCYVTDKGLSRLAGWIPRINRPVVRLYKALDFHDTGYRRIEGSIRGKPAEWIMFEFHGKAEFH